MQSATPDAPLALRKVGPVEAMNSTQGQYIATILSRDVTFGIGPAGTGKTFLAASLAAEALSANQIDHIIVTRPMTPCDEDMGFLPGDIDEKYLPWLEPVMDVLDRKLGKGATKYFLKAGKIQAKPLMFMRGKSFERSWILLDEAQNVTPEQMKMLLTRMGEGCKLIISGDTNQSDLKDRRGIRQQDGLSDALSRLRGLPEIGVVEFNRSEIVRHGLIRKILERYETD